MTALTELLAKVDVQRLIEFHEKRSHSCSYHGSHSYAVRHDETVAILRALIAQEATDEQETTT